MTPDVLAAVGEVLARLERIERRLAAGVVRESYTVRQAPERLGLSEWTVRQAANLRRIRAVKSLNGRDWRIPHDELMRVEAQGLPPQD